MSDIRFNQWLHQSGTGGVTQISSGHVGIGTTNPLIPVHSANTATLNVGIITANNIYAGTLNGTLALSNISGITGSFTSDVTINGNLDIVDKIRHIGDTNTAIRFPANDIISFETAGNEKLRIASDSSLEIFNGSNSSTIKLKRHASTASEQAHIGYFSTGLHIETREATYLSLKTNTQERLRIDSVGKITTNTTGTIIADYNSSNSGGGYFQYDIGANGATIGYMGAASHLTGGGSNTDLGIRAANNLDIAVGGSARKVFIYNSGNIQLNTTGTLAVDFNSSNGAGAYFNFDIGANGANIGYLGAGSHLVSGTATADLAIRSTNNFDISTGGATRRFRITSDGKVVAGGTGAGYPSRLQSHGTGNLLDLNSTSGAAVIRFYESGSGRFDLRTNNGSSGLNFYDSLNGVERLRIDSNGDLGLGIAAVPQDSGARTLHIHDTTTGSGARAAIRLTHGSTGSAASNGAFIGMDNNPDFYLYNQENGNIRFGSNGTERVRIRANGDFQVDSSNNNITGQPAFFVHTSSGCGSYRPHSGFPIHHFYSNAGGTYSLESYVNGDGSYVNLSDYRLKENIVSISNGMDIVKKLNPVKFDWTSSSKAKNDLGFIAHEVQTLIPTAVDGTKDQMKEDGSPFYQGIAQTKIIPYLTAALKEAIAKVETLEAKVAALESS